MQKSVRKLSLSRETLRHLADPRLERILGGTSYYSARMDADCDTIVDTRDSFCSCAGDEEEPPAGNTRSC